ncbi:probable L-type lectin-domain containing receptor kinase S.5 [Punica granatum]|uniref:Protein kinase domain-containing protein n=2 Tax=Punica granatum TaxID=22663 RepID=A0A218X3A7_PUNGR|nr:probable L-type lectin-domain containing receptor kinase S.5 [Punica granatum]OWM78971.1 hypothetical protein CDL15_Pgr003142 [Punica granatum]PKI42891.1 hypothetical protein CRG98_036689 [Punica granatum]
MNFTLLLAILLIICLLMPHSGYLKFNYSTFYTEDEDNFIRRNSYIVLNAIQVTPDVKGAQISNRSGRIYYEKPLKLWGRRKGGSRAVASFDTTFVLNISPQTDPGGDGLAFILAGDTTLPTNSSGKWLGIVNSSTNGSPQNQIVAIEFDTLKSHDEDIDSNHVGLDVNSIYSVKQVALDSYGVSLSAATDITATIRYDGANISVFVHLSNDTGESTKSPILTMLIDLSSYLPKNVFVGFSASTSNATELNCVKSWAFEGSDIVEHQNLKWLWIVISVMVVIVIVGVVAFLCWKRSTYRDPRNQYPRIEAQIEDSTMVLNKFRLRQLKKATGNFDPKNKLGEGGFGIVYKGHLLDRDVAVKRISKNSRQGIQEFLAEVTTIRSLNQRNLVKLIGWCYERSELLLVYEYMSNGSLDKFIYRDDKLIAEEMNLNWGTRYNIIRGIARALDYLHNGCERRVLHRDIKASNIMLDSDFNARLGDFGLARMIQQTEQTHHSTKEIAGTPGYMAPESFLIGRATVETDVYAFGVLMLVIISGRMPGDQKEESNIVHWIWELHRQGRIISAVDSTLDGNVEEMQCVLKLGLACCHPNPHNRPSMRVVLQVLAGEAPDPLVPLERPAFVWPAMPPSFKGDVDISLTNGQLTPITELVGR